VSSFSSVVVITIPVQKSDHMTASLKITHVLVKRWKPFQDGELLNEAVVSAAESFFSTF